MGGGVIHVLADGRGHWLLWPALGRSPRVRSSAVEYFQPQ